MCFKTLETKLVSKPEPLPNSPSHEMSLELVCVAETFTHKSSMFMTRRESLRILPLLVCEHQNKVKLIICKHIFRTYLRLEEVKINLFLPNQTVQRTVPLTISTIGLIKIFVIRNSFIFDSTKNHNQLVQISTQN
jgi:hypothetical protein